MINNRQNGRRRGRGGPRPQGNPGQPGGGNRIDNRARGNAQQLHEKYKNLARDAQMAGDRVTTEYYLQFADHYFRVLSESRARFEEQRPQRGSDDEFEGDDGGDEFEARDQGQRRDNRDRGERNSYRRDDERRERAPEQAQQQPVQAFEAANEEQRGGDEQQRRPRRPRNRRPEGSEPAEAFDADRLPPAIAVDNTANEEAPAPRRRGRRPRTETANDDAVEVPPAA
ncbi:DUF4167 domain-containing protein [Sphingomonas tabacisoli]|uniref:DUF4167 domain-containing protein n=1 Tax=Sphingomonas tabacisoli TaxID=2249466 RepID=A0ABW4I7M9_9SPHN